MNINLESIPVYAPDIKARDEAFGTLLVTKRTPILTLNDDSTAIWRKVDGVKNIAIIISELKEEYGCSDTDFEAAVISFLDNCNKLGLITFR